MAQAERDTGCGRGTRGRQLAVGPEQPRQPSGPDDQRHRQLAAEQGQALVASSGAVKRPGQERNRAERALVRPQRALVLGPAVDKVEQRAGQGTTGEAPRLLDAVEFDVSAAPPWLPARAIGC